MSYLLTGKGAEESPSAPAFSIASDLVGIHVMLAQQTIQGACLSTTEPHAGAVRPINVEAGRIHLWIGADRKVDAAIISPRGLGAIVTVPVLTGTDDCVAISVDSSIVVVLHVFSFGPLCPLWQ